MQTQLGHRLGDRLFSGKSLPGAKRALLKPSGRSMIVKPVGVAEFVKDSAAGKNGSKPISLESDGSGVEYDILRKLNFVVGTEHADADTTYRATALSVREHLIDAFNKTQQYWKEKDPKFVYYLSAEFLMGRSLLNTIYNLGLEGTYGAALQKLGYSLEAIQDEEQNAALGNGGLGRLAACFLDSIATLDLPGWGYGIRYKYGMFKQGLDDGGLQKEMPDIWLQNGNPWEIKRNDIKYKVGFYGSVDNHKWTPEEVVYAQAYDNPIPGYKTSTVGNLRLFEALPVAEFDLDAFNEGAYDKAILEKRKAEDISAVLYPNDATEYGKELRLKQQIFFVSASIQDVIARFKETHSDFEKLPEKAVFQMNDTHPTIAVAELMRLLLDQEGLDWDKAWGITVKTLAFTNHTVMPEALEKWPVRVLGKLLPRHMEIIDKIDSIWKDSLKEKVLAQLEAEGKLTKDKKPKKAAAAAETDAKKGKVAAEEEEEEEDPVEAELTKYGIITENPWEKGVKLVNMAYLAVIGSKSTNGVAAIHSEIIKETIFKDFYELYPEKFQNKTNGVTPRRWLAFCNPELSALITKTLGSDNWITHTDELKGLLPHADDAAFQKEWRQIKQDNKERLAAKIKEITGIVVPTSSMFDIQIKRIHEYKRQYMNLISIISRYIAIKKASPEERAKFVPRVCVFGGKAASAYYMAKKIVRLATAVGATVNNDPEVGDLLKVVFLPDYNVSLAEVIIPASEVSQHISTAGTEASGTSNMKFQMNGCLILGTNDGANIEIAEEVGKENLFTFGVDAADVPRLREERKDFKDYDPRWKEAFKWIYDGKFGDKEYFKDLADSVNDMTKGNDWFLVANDFASYMDAQDQVDALYKDQTEWTRRSIKMTATSGFFSSDRTIRQYADEIWGVVPVKQA